MFTENNIFLCCIFTFLVTIMFFLQSRKASRDRYTEKIRPVTNITNQKSLSLKERKDAKT